MRLFYSFLTLFLICCPPVLAAKPLPYDTKPYRLTSEDKEELTRIEKYLGSLRTISSEFTQGAPNGDISTGKFYLERPGRLRMEYDAPMPVLMVAAGSDIVYYDKELDQVTHIPLEDTLVGFLARDTIKFDAAVTITSFERGSGTLRLSLIQTKRPRDGMLTLEFSDKPLLIRNMVVTDSAGQMTTVALNNARFDLPLSKDLFIFKDPHLGSKAGINKGR